MRTDKAAVLMVLLAVALTPSGATGQAETDWLTANGFRQRAADALLHGDREAIRTWRRRSITEVLEDVPRVEIRGAGGDRFFVMHASERWRDDPADEGCFLDVYLNGGSIHTAYGQRATTRSVDRAVNMRDLDGLEVHGAETSPVGDGRCGAVLLWSGRVRRQVDEPFEGHLRGRALWTPDETPAGDIEMTLEPGSIRQATDSGGWFDFGGLAPGLYRITATTPGGASWSGRVVVRAYAISQIAIEVSRRDGGDPW